MVEALWGCGLVGFFFGLMKPRSHGFHSLLKNSQTCNPKRERGSESTRNQGSNSLAHASGYIFNTVARPWE